jgi:hypothetical protein
MKEDTEAEKVFWAWIYLYYLSPSRIDLPDCRMLAGCSAMDAARHALFPGMNGAPTLAQVRQRVQLLDPDLVIYARHTKNAKHEATIAELTAARMTPGN